jgi:Tfp pilus assembly protein FimV
MRSPLITSSLTSRRGQLAVALLALLCMSPFGLPALPPLPVLLGLVPEPIPVEAPPEFSAVDSGWGDPAPAQAVTAAARDDEPVVAAPQTPPPVDTAPQSAEQQARGSALPVLPPDATPRGRYHRVEPGETAATIAARYGLANQWAIYDANPVIVRPNRLPVGTWLYIPHPSVLPASRPRPGQPGYTGQPSSTLIVDGVWLDIAACESSGNWFINTGNNYYGGLQFTLDSWRYVGGAGYPHEAHPMEQIARADYLQRIQGWKAWPMCAEKLGLLPPGEGKAHVERARAAQRAKASDSPSPEPPDEPSE